MNELKEIKKTNDKKRLFEKILEDINNGTATVKDYNDFERILKEVGADSEQAKNTLRQHNIKNWEQYIKKRKNANTYKKKRETDAIIAGTLVGIGIAALLFFFSKNDE